MQDGVNSEELDELIGTVLSNVYEIHSTIAKGSTSKIYKARNKFVEKYVAVKLLNAELAKSPMALKRFQFEAQVTCSIAHPGIVATHDFGFTESGRPYLILELLDGKTLSKQLADSGPMPAQTARDLFQQLCNTLQHCHSKGVIHRGLNPGDIILLSANGNKSKFSSKIIDFGIAKRLWLPEAIKDAQLVPVPEIIGSPLYMSPEQRLAQSVDARSDVYALGCVMYEVLVGRPPFSGENLTELHQKHIHDQPISPSNATSGLSIPGSLESVILKALQKEPASRYQSMSEILHALSK